MFFRQRRRLLKRDRREGRKSEVKRGKRLRQRGRKKSDKMQGKKILREKVRKIFKVLMRWRMGKEKG